MFGAATCGEVPEEQVQEEQALEETPQEAPIGEGVQEGIQQRQKASYYGEGFAASRQHRGSRTTRTVSRWPIRTCRSAPSLQ